MLIPNGCGVTRWGHLVLSVPTWLLVRPQVSGRAVAGQRDRPGLRVPRPLSQCPVPTSRRARARLRLAFPDRKKVRIGSTRIVSDDFLYILVQPRLHRPQASSPASRYLRTAGAAGPRGAAASWAVMKSASLTSAVCAGLLPALPTCPFRTRILPSSDGFDAPASWGLRISPEPRRAAVSHGRPSAVICAP
jgi:hypothetical protein